MEFARHACYASYETFELYFVHYFISKKFIKKSSELATLRARAVTKMVKKSKKLGCSAEKRFDYRVLAVLLVPSIRWWDYRKVDKSGSEKLSVDDEFLTFNRSCKILHHTARGTDPNY